VVAHPDDLEYGAASAVARWTSQGKGVNYLLITRGEAGIDGLQPEVVGSLRAEEERRSAEVAGAASLDFLNYRDGLIEYGLQLRRDITRYVRRHHPEVLITLNRDDTWGGHWPNSPDHRAVGTAVMDAALDAGNRWIFQELADEGLEPWGGVKMICFSGSARPTHAVDVTDFLDKGVASLREHKTYIEQFEGFDPDRFLREGAEACGKRLGCSLALTFEVLGASG
jgi:LmbE family N-acetylglucosaminyl deacetylase